ncbi:MAG: pantetheine-phosphate adenylyltransferase [Candidatus Mycalebacterium zealandia]|nr:MAG: pantetheine-phosphate adenylyltransferase [Candidatus Mycalebacterium zealandia]
MKRTAIYPGSFDPLTLGHINIIERGAEVFDELTVAVAETISKSAAFSAKQRVEMVAEAVKGEKNVKVESFDGLLMYYATQKGVKTILRGMRSVSDFEYELRMATANKALNPEIETVFMVTDAKHSHISSSLIKEIVTLGGSAAGLVPDFVEKRLREKLLGE